MTNRRLSPHRLARLANALGVSTPIPQSTAASVSVSTSTGFLLHVVPPVHLPHDQSGSLVPFHSTLYAQLAAIAREYALPSTAGLVLYLIQQDQLSPPRLSDDAWRVLSSRVDRSPSPFSPRPLACSPSPSPLPISPPPPSIVPILAKVQFDIDKQKATWYLPWLNNRRSRKHPPFDLITVKRQFNNFDPDATATLAQPYPSDDDDDIDDIDDNSSTAPSTREEEEVLEMLESMSRKSVSSLRSRPTSKSNLDPPRKLIFPPLLINALPNQPNPNLHKDDLTVIHEEDSFLAYTEPVTVPTLKHSEPQGVKREFAIFDDLDLDLDPTLPIDDDDPNDRRKSQLIMRAKLDEIERTMAQLSPRDLSLSLSPSDSSSSLGVSPISPLPQPFLSPIREFVTSSPPRLPEPDSQSWPAVPFSKIKQKHQPEDPNAPPPPPTLAVNGVSTLPPRAFIPAPTRPPPPPPLNSIGLSPMSETEKRRRELEESEDAGVIPLSPDPFGRFPSSSPTEPVVTEKRTRSGTIVVNGEPTEVRVRSGTMTSQSRFSADSGEGSAKNTTNRTTLMSVRTIKKLWRKSKEKDGAPPPTPTAAGFVNDVDKSLPEIPPPPQRPERPSREQLDLPDISMQAVVPPRLSPSPSLRDNNNGRRTPQELMSTGRRTPQESIPTGRRTPQDLIPTGRRTPQDLIPTGRRTPQEQLMPPPTSRPSLDVLTPPLDLTGRRTPQDGRRTPQEQMTFPAASRPSLDGSRPSLDQVSPVSPAMAQQIPMFQGRNPNNGQVMPLLAKHYPSRSFSASNPAPGQQQQFDMNRLMFDQESPYPVRLPSFGTTTTAPKVPPSIEPEKPTTISGITTMRKSILKWKLPNGSVNTNTNTNTNGNGHDSASSSSSSSAVGAVAIPRQSFERVGASTNGNGHGHGRGGVRRPSVINFGSTSSSSSSSVSSTSVKIQTAVRSGGGEDVPPNPPVPVQYTSGTDTKPVQVHFKLPSQNPTRGLVSPSESQSQDHAFSPATSIERRSDTSSFDMTLFEFVSPVIPTQNR